MTKTSFPFRLVFDYEFYDKVIKENAKTNPQDRPGLLTKLMYVNSNSKEYGRRHNIMSMKTFNKILTDNSSMSKSLLRASFYPSENSSEIEVIDDEIERNIKYAIDLASSYPYKTIILTTLANEKKYLTNSHYAGVKEISVKSGNESLILLNDFWDSCSQK